MPSDTSPPSGYRLESPPRADGGSAPRQPRAAAPSKPSWLKVIGTTLRLWLRRRVLHVPDSGRIGSRRLRRLGLLLSVLVVVAGGGTAAGVTLTAAGTPAAQHAHFAAGRLTPQQLAARQAAQRAAQANATAAANWITAQVAQGTVIGCDPAACAAILRAGYATPGQVVLQRGVRLPGPGSLIVATGAIRGQYGRQLASTAPEVIAVFGTGAQAVQVRLAVAGGAPGYAAAVRTRQAAGRSLLDTSRVHASGAVRSEIGRGQLDPRLAAALRRLAGRYSVAILGLADAGPSPAGIELPYRMAQIVVPKVRARHHRVSALPGMRRLLSREPAADRPELSSTRLGGRLVLQLAFRAPAPA